MQALMTRRLLIALLLGLVAVGAASARNPHDPQTRFSAADQAWARTLLVTGADLTGGGWRSHRSSPDGTCRSFNPDESDLVETGERKSPEFDRNGSLVTSMAMVFKSSAQAQASWNREVKAQLLDCLAEGLNQASTGQVQVWITSRGPLAVPALAPRRAGFRVRLAFNVQGVRLGANLHLVVLGRGRANVLLITMSTGRPLTPLPAGLERSLTARLAQRLSAGR
jgi:hypothetical protein